MRAAWYEKQEPARDVLVLGEVPDPIPGPGEIVESQFARLFHSASSALRLRISTRSYSRSLNKRACRLKML
jgi:hypothetical protein